MRTNQMRVAVLLAIVGVPAMAMVGCGGSNCSEVDNDGKPCLHRCSDATTYSSTIGWLGKGLVLAHLEPRDCPFEITLGEKVLSGGTVTDLPPAEFTKMTLRMENATHQLLIERSADFVEFFNTGSKVATVFVQYLPATSGIWHDWARYYMDTGSPWAEVMIDYSGEGLLGPSRSP